MPLPRSFQKQSVDPPTRRHLAHWAEVCRYIDAQSHRRIRIPFPDDPPMSPKLFKHMAQFKLIGHRDDCTWQLSPRWQSILQRLAQGVPPEQATKDALRDEGDPFVVDYGPDTMYVNVLAEEMPAQFLTVAYQLKELAQVAYKPLETPWRFGGKPLSLLPNGKATTETGGVSWGLILRNDLVEIRLRKRPVTGIVGMIHFMAECLWLNQAKPSLDLMVRCLKTMWADPDLYDQVQYQLSQIHLCVDIAHFPLTLEHLPRLVTRSLKRAVHVPALADLDLDDTGLEPDTTYSDDDDGLYEGIPPNGWGDEEEVYDPSLDIDPDEAFAEGTDDDEDATDDEESDDQGESEEKEPDATRWDVDGGKIHWRGQRIEGIGFSPAGAMSAAWYDKILEERKAKFKKPWMREIHKAGGWQLGMTLTRFEYRHKRPIMNELEVALGHDKGKRWFDDPWIACDHFGELWGFDVGLPPEHDQTPDVTMRGWMRLAMPDPHDSNRTRWRTDPLWELVQRVPFSQGMPQPLRRVKEAKPDLDQIDAQLRGYLISRAVVRGAYLKAPANLSRELEDFDNHMAAWEQDKGLDFTEEVRERARMMGKQLPYREPLILPPRPKRRQQPPTIGAESEASA